MQGIIQVITNVHSTHSNLMNQHTPDSSEASVRVCRYTRYMPTRMLTHRTEYIRRVQIHTKQSCAYSTQSKLLLTLSLSKHLDLALCNQIRSRHQVQLPPHTLYFIHNKLPDTLYTLYTRTIYTLCNRQNPNYTPHGETRGFEHKQPLTQTQ